MKILAGIIVAAAIIFVLFAAVFMPIYYVKGTERQVDMHVVKTERIYDNGESKYLIYAKEGTYENKDSLLNGKFNSSDLYGKLLAGKEYNCKVYGWRMPLFSNYPNIVNCEAK